MSSRKVRFATLDDGELFGRKMSPKELLREEPDGPYLTREAREEAVTLLPAHLAEHLKALAQALNSLANQDTYVGDITSLLLAAHDIAKWCRRPRRLNKALRDVEEHVSQGVVGSDFPTTMRTPAIWSKELFGGIKSDLERLRAGDAEKAERHLTPADTIAYLLVMKIVWYVPGMRQRTNQKIVNEAVPRLAKQITPRSHPYNVLRSALRVLGMPAKEVDAALATQRKAYIRGRNAPTRVK